MGKLIQLEVQHNRTHGALMLAGRIHFMGQELYLEAVCSPGHGTWVMIGHGGIGIREDQLMLGIVRDQFGIPTLRGLSRVT